jgi:hypothetical protein
VSRALCCGASAASLLSLSVMRAVYERALRRRVAAAPFRHARLAERPRPG